MADFPPVQDADSDDVRWALETANTMWTQGDKQEALKWLKRAAESAEQGGDDMRSLMLAKARAELHSLAEHEIAGELVTNPAMAPFGAPPRAAPSGPPPFDPSPISASPISASPISARHPSGQAPPSTPPSRPPSGVPPQRSAPPARSASRPGPPPARTSAPAPAPSPTGSAPQSGRFDTDDARTTLVHPGRGPLPMPSPTRGPVDERRAVRVAVQPIEGQPGVFLTRPLRPGERPAPGAAEALLVSVEPGIDPLSGR